LKALVEYLFQQWFRLLVHVNCYSAKNKYLYYIDIDNTLADTFPSLLLTYTSEKKRLLELKPHHRIIRILQQCYVPSKRKFIFISARSFKQYFTTITWLRNQGLKAGLFNTIIVKHPEDKISLIEKNYKPNKTIVIDDLSYHHEFGEIKYYNAEINKLKGLKLKYIDYSTILKINTGAQ